MSNFEAIRSSYIKSSRHDRSLGVEPPVPEIEAVAPVEQAPPSAAAPVQDEPEDWLPSAEGPEPDFGVMFQGGVDLPPAMVRVAKRMGPERFQMATQLSQMLDLGVSKERLAPEAQALLAERADLTIEEQVAEFDALTYANEQDSGDGLANLVRMTLGGNPQEGTLTRLALDTTTNLMQGAVNAAAEFSDRALSTVPQAVYGLSSLISGEAPATMNDAIGLEGIESPRVGYYLGAVDRLLADKAVGREGKTLSDHYQAIARGEEIRQDRRGTVGQIAQISAGVGGDLFGLLSGSMPVGKIAGGIEKLTGTEKLAHAIGKMGAKAKDPLARFAALAGREAVLPGARFAAWEGIGQYVDPQTGEMFDGGERLWHAAQGALWSPVFSASGAIGARAAAMIRGDGVVVRGAWANWLKDLDPAAKQQVAELGDKGFNAAWSTFVMNGMPGVSTTVRSRLLGEAVQSTVEGLGFSINDDAFWHLAKEAYLEEDPDKAKAKAWEAAKQFLANPIVMSAMRFGGSRKALTVREAERLQEDLQAAIAKQPEQAQTAPEAMPEPDALPPDPGVIEPVTEADTALDARLYAESEARDAEMAPHRRRLIDATDDAQAMEDIAKDTETDERLQTEAEVQARVASIEAENARQDAEIKAAEDWLDTQSDPAVEADLLVSRATKRANEVEDPDLRDAYLDYAARAYRWRETGIDAPKASFKGKVPDDVKAWEQDLHARRSRVSTRAAEQAKAVEEGRAPDAPKPRPVSRFDLNVIAKGLGGRVEEGRQAKTRNKSAAEKPVRPLEEKPADAQPDFQAEETRALRYRRDAQLAEAKLALDGLGEPTAEEGIRLVYDRKSKPKFVTYENGKYLERDVYGDATWRELPVKKALAIRGKTKQPDAIPEQLAVVEQVAKRVLELGDQLSPEQLRFFSAAMNMATGINRHAEPGVNAALSLAEQVLPSSWGPRHVDLWSQMAMRGFSPEAQQAILNEFAVTPAPKGETPQQRELRKAQTLKAKEQKEAERQALADTKQAERDAKAAEAKREEAIKKAEAEGRSKLARIYAKARSKDGKKPRSTPDPYLNPTEYLEKVETEDAPAPEVVPPGTEPTATVKPTTVEAVVAKTTADLASLSDDALRGMAETAGIDPTLPRDTLIEMLGLRAGGTDESGKVSIPAMVGVGAVGLMGMTTFFHDPVLAGYFGAALGGATVLRELVNRLGIPHFERLRQFASKDLTEPVIRLFRQVDDRIKHYEGKLSEQVRRVKVLTREALGESGRAYREATRALQHVNWASGADNTYGRSNLLMYLDGQVPLPANLPTEQREILEAVRELIQAGGQEAMALNMQMLEKSTGKVFTPKFNRNRWVMPRVMSGDGVDIMAEHGSKAWTVLRDAIMDLNGWTIQEAETKMALVSSERGFKRSAMEFARVIEKLPDYIRVDGREIAILESRPFEYADAYRRANARRLASVEVWGQESFSPDGISVTAGGERLGITLTDAATQSQVDARDALRQFVEGSENRPAALLEVLKSMRAQAGLQTGKSKNFLGFDIASEGKIRHAMRHIVIPLRSLDVALKLVKPVMQSWAEPLGGAVATVVGSQRIATHWSRAYFAAVREPGFLRSEYEKFQKIGGLVGDQELRFGAFNFSEPSVHRSADIARQLGMVAMLNTKANFMGDMALAMATESWLKQAKAGELDWRDLRRLEYAADLFNMDAADKAAILDGSFTPEVGYTFMRRAREHLLFVRDGGTSGSLATNRTFRFLVPFTQWASGNLRFNARMLQEFASTIKVSPNHNPSLNADQRMARRLALFKYAVNKSVTTGIGVASMALWAYAHEMASAFEGYDDEQTAINFLEKWAEVGLFTELGLPVVGTMVFDALKGGRNNRSMIDAVVSASWPADMALDAWAFYTNTGPFRKTTSPGLIGFPGKLWKFAEERAPFLKDIVNWFQDPELKAAIDRRYRFIPSKGGANNQDFDAFQNQMGQFVETVNNGVEDVANMDRDWIRGELLKAAQLMRFKLQREPHGEGEAFQGLSSRKQIRAGWDAVVDSLNAVRTLHGLSDPEHEALKQEMGERMYQRLVDYDAHLDKFVAMAKRYGRQAAGSDE